MYVRIKTAKSLLILHIVGLSASLLMSMVALLGAAQYWRYLDPIIHLDVSVRIVCAISGMMLFIISLCGVRITWRTRFLVLWKIRGTQLTLYSLPVGVERQAFMDNIDVNTRLKKDVVDLTQSDVKLFVISKKSPIVNISWDKSPIKYVNCGSVAQRIALVTAIESARVYLAQVLTSDSTQAEKDR